MNKVFWFWVILFVAVGISLCADEFHLEGIWANPFYNPSWDKPAKIVVSPDDTISLYRMEMQDHMIYEGSFIIDEDWVDEEGNYWCHISFPEVYENSRYELWKANKKDTILEKVSSSLSYPTKLNIKDSSYLILYRRIDYTGENMEPCFGTWSNADYDTHDHRDKVSKIALSPEGSALAYLDTSDTVPAITGVEIITDKWIDSDGNTWFKNILYVSRFGTTAFVLIKINKSGDVMERQEVFGNMYFGDYPSTFDSESLLHWILYREE